jgi:hypothetical protein
MGADRRGENLCRVNPFDRERARIDAALSSIAWSPRGRIEPLREPRQLSTSLLDR